MDNATRVYGKDGANLREITLDRVEELTGLFLWSNVGANNFDKRRKKLSGGKWWMAGQPTPRS